MSAATFTGEAEIFLHALHASGDSNANSNTSPEPRFTPAVEIGTAHKVTSANTLASSSAYDSDVDRQPMPRFVEYHA